MTWIDHDPATRTTCLPALLSHVRLRHLGQDFLKTQLTQNSYIQENRLAQDMIRRTLAGGTDQAPRPATLKRPTLIVLGGLNSCILNCMQSFSPTKTSWLPCPSMPVDSLAWFSVAVVSNILFVIGGIKAGNIMSTVYSYSPSLGLWSECCPMPQARARHAAVAVGSSHIFVFGGITLTQRGIDLSRNGGSDPIHVEDGRLDRIVPNSYQRTAGSVPIVSIANTIIRYDLCTDSWSTVGRSGQPRLESRVVVVDEGGSGGSLTASPPPVELSPCVVDCTFGPDGSNLSVSGELAASSNEVRSSGNFVRDNGHRRRHLSSHTHAERTLVEIGGVSETHPQGTDQVMLYSLRSDLTVTPTGDYIKLPQASRYINATVRQELLSLRPPKVIVVLCYPAKDNVWTVGQITSHNNSIEHHLSPGLLDYNRECISLLERHHAADTDELPSTLFKDGGEFSSQCLSNLFAPTWENEPVSDNLGQPISVYVRKR
ncbi:hypothetical protein T265_10430 [Opisthorchis viverrini]|uniref:BACK domain-containing protein n=1 Tax=Opisthorchis viverrini TaxID=6198 RepID=A0A074ZDB0_OPIVI|nr:hypothetical protein T265_10430 [Opisthorchis viverrini]KER21175.1 hypothetical protein T265_10430 [Opisthorchis viverrini]